MFFFTSKKFYIPLIIVVIVAGIGYRQYKKSHQPPQFETVKVARDDLKQTVEATGKVESVNDLTLRFETPGTVADIPVSEGAEVKAGEVLASLKLAELNAAVAQAQANLNQKIAGATDSERAYYKAVVDQAKADWDKAKTDTQTSIHTAESALETAKNNLKLAEGGENSQIVGNAYEDAVTLLQSSLSTLDDGLAQADNILGIDNTLANDDFEKYLATLDTNKINIANSYYYAAKDTKSAARNLVLPLTIASGKSSIDAALESGVSAFVKMNQLLLSVSDVLAATQPVGTLTQASLTAKKTTIETTRSAVNTQYTNLVNQKQTIVEAKSSYSNYKVAHDKAVKDLADAKSAAESTLKIKEAAHNQALANWQNKVNPAREVDLAPFRAVLAQAIASRDKAVIKAPIDGIVTKVNKKKGELVTSADIMVQMLSPHYEVKVDIPETDVPKLKEDNAVNITLDAFGDDVKFTGKVINIEPASTEIQDVVYYKVTVQLEDSDKEVKPGMTANVTISTDSRANVLYIPLRAVRGDGEKKVRILANGQEQEVAVILGMKADEGKVEILSGLQENQEIILSVKK